MKSTAGKGTDPIKGYNMKKWYTNFDTIRWDNTGNKQKPKNKNKKNAKSSE